MYQKIFEILLYISLGVILGKLYNWIFSDNFDNADKLTTVIHPISYSGYKMMLVVRNDLKMGKGKIAAQCCHATLGCYKKNLKNPDLLPTINQWEIDGQAKVVVKCNSQDELLETAHIANTQGLITSIVYDAGRTQIASGSMTVLAIGPAPIGEFTTITGHLKLM